MLAAFYARAEAWFTGKVPHYQHRHAVLALAISVLAGVTWCLGLLWAWQINAALLLAGAIVRDIEKEDTLQAPAWWWVLVPIAVAVTSVVVASSWAFAGAWFYSGRELRDRERLGYWDHKGYWWPWLACTLLWLLIVLVNTAINLWRAYA